jgi:hypothetical protein
MAARPAPTYLAATGSIFKLHSDLKGRPFVVERIYQWPG